MSHPCDVEPKYDSDTQNVTPLRVYTNKPANKSKTEEFLDRLAELSQQNVQLACAKNADYANDGDPFGNFTLCEKLGVATVQAGLMVRMTDKVARIANLLYRDPATNESILDALSDLANYALILRIWLEWQQK